MNRALHASSFSDSFLQNTRYKLTIWPTFQILVVYLFVWSPYWWSQNLLILSSVWLRWATLLTVWCVPSLGSPSLLNSWREMDRLRNKHNSSLSKFHEQREKVYIMPMKITQFAGENILARSKQSAQINQLRYPPALHVERECRCRLGSCNVFYYYILLPWYFPWNSWMSMRIYITVLNFVLISTIQYISQLIFIYNIYNYISTYV